MRIVRSVRHNVCTDGSFMREVLIDVVVPESFVIFLRNFGSVLILPDMGPGFFKYEMKDGFSIKGMIGDTNLEMRYQRDVMDLCEDFVSVLFYYYHDGNPDMNKLQRMNETLQKKIQVRHDGKSER